MNYIDEIFARANTQQLRNFLNHGTQEENVTRIKSIAPNELGEEFYTISSELSQAFTVYEEVYMEIGIKTGIRLIIDLLQVDMPDLKKD